MSEETQFNTQPISFFCNKKNILYLRCIIISEWCTNSWNDWWPAQKCIIFQTIFTTIHTHNSLRHAIVWTTWRAGHTNSNKLFFYFILFFFISYSSSQEQTRNKKYNRIAFSTYFFQWLSSYIVCYLIVFCKCFDQIDSHFQGRHYEIPYAHIQRK